MSHGPEEIDLRIFSGGEGIPVRIGSVDIRLNPDTTMVQIHDEVPQWSNILVETGAVELAFVHVGIELASQLEMEGCLTEHSDFPDRETIRRLEQTRHPL